MENYHYTARLVSENTILASRGGNDLNRLKVYLVANIEDDYAYAIGQIIDNHDGSIVHQCLKAAVE